MSGLKRFLTNKNTITILGVLLIIGILYFGYNYAVSMATESITVPYAKVAIQPRTRVTEDMIGHVKVLKSTLKGKTITDDAKVIDKYININAYIPEGSLFYADSLIEKEELPDIALTEIPNGTVAFNLSVDINSTYGNSIYPNNYIDIYFKAINDDGKVMVGKLLENVKVLAVKDKSGNHVFEDTSANRTPASIIFAVSEEIHLLLRKATYLSGGDTRVELIPVPTNESMQTTPGTTAITSTVIVNYINSRSVMIAEDTTVGGTGE